MEKEFLCNKIFEKNEIKKMLLWFLYNYGGVRTKSLVENLKSTTLQFSTKAGFSMGINDLIIPQAKKNIFENSKRELRETYRYFKNGKLSYVAYLKKYKKTWNVANDLVKNEILTNYRQVDILNPLYVMTISGARGNISQVRQILGMRGLVITPKGDLLDLPIKNNLKEGVNITEYFLSCYGARKGIIDTALKTATAGYLTRKLIYSSQKEIIRHTNCNTKLSNLIITVKNDKQEYDLMKENLIGRVIAKNIIEEKTKNKIASYGQDICNVRFGLGN